MIAEADIATFQTNLVEQHIPLAHSIATLLKRRFHWLDSDDLYSYSLLGLNLAMRIWQPDRGITFGSFAKKKAMYLAIDEMRHDRMLHRETKHHKRTISLNQTNEDFQKEYEVTDPRGQDDFDRLEDRDMIESIFRSLSPYDRNLLQMYYSEGMTFGEIAVVLDVSQSTVCLRHKALLAHLRILAKGHTAEGGMTQ